MLRLALPALVLAGALVFAAPAHAAPGLPSSLAFGPVRVGVGIGVGVPVGRPVRHVQPAGYWAWQDQEVVVPARVIGYDRFGRAIVTPGYTEIRRVRVWVPARRVVVRRAAPVRVGFGVGFGWGW